MKLKTLKDLKEDCFVSSEDFPFVRYEELKAEAVKWVKKFKGYYWGEQQANIFMDFFNLTNEDLKEKEE